MNTNRYDTILGLELDVENTRRILDSFARITAVPAVIAPSIPRKL